MQSHFGLSATIPHANSSLHSAILKNVRQTRSMNRLWIIFLFVSILSCKQPTNHINIKTNLIQLQILYNNQGGHRDLLFKISGLTEQKTFDSYFFLVANRRNENINLTAGVAALFEYWKEKILLMQNGETIFLPIDFSDQYTGCLQVDKIGSTTKLTYGFSEIWGLNVNPLNPGNFYKDVNDFEGDGKTITVNQEVMIESLNTLITELQKRR